MTKVIRSPLFLGPAVLIVALLSAGVIVLGQRGSRKPRAAGMHEADGEGDRSMPRMRHFETRPVAPSSAALPPAEERVAGSVPAREDPVASARRFVADIVQSGPSNAPWTRDATRSLQSMTGTLPEEHRSQVILSDVRCFRKACFLEMRYPGTADFQFVSDRILDAGDTEFNRWPGLRQLTSPIVGSEGKMVVTWALVPKEES